MFKLYSYEIEWDFKYNCQFSIMVITNYMRVTYVDFNENV